MSRSAAAADEQKRLQSPEQSRVDDKAVQSLEALWNPRSNDEGRAALEQLQTAVAAQGTSRGLNGMPMYLPYRLIRMHTECISYLLTAVIQGLYPSPLKGTF